VAVTLKEVALKAEVSRSAVSRTFMPGASVPAKMRSKVEEAARGYGGHHGYQIDAIIAVAFDVQHFAPIAKGAVGGDAQTLGADWPVACCVTRNGHTAEKNLDRPNPVPILSKKFFTRDK